MKANELTVGDLVTFKDCQYDDDIIVVKIYQINQENNALVFIDDSDSLDQIDIDQEIVGIPITKEILEKNGFENYKTIGSLSYYKNKDNNLKFEFYGKTLEDYAGNRIIELGYVHELQHALKLCGIDKTIEL